MRIVLSGAACSRQRGQTVRESSAVTEPARRAVVRLSGGGEVETSTVETSAFASATAAVRPASPPPITTVSTTNLSSVGEFIADYVPTPNADPCDAASARKLYSGIRNFTLSQIGLCEARTTVQIKGR